MIFICTKHVLGEKNGLNKKPVKPYTQQLGRQLRRISYIFARVLNYLSGGK